MDFYIRPPSGLAASGEIGSIACPQGHALLPFTRHPLGSVDSRLPGTGRDINLRYSCLSFRKDKEPPATTLAYCSNMMRVF